MVVTHDDQHAAIAAGTGQVAVPQRVSRSIYPRSLAIPHGEHAIETPITAQTHLLSTPDRRCCKVLVDGRLKLDLVLVEMFSR